MFWPVQPHLLATRSHLPGGVTSYTRIIEQDRSLESLLKMKYDTWGDQYNIHILACKVHVLPRDPPKTPNAHFWLCEWAVNRNRESSSSNFPIDVGELLPELRGCYGIRCAC